MLGSALGQRFQRAGQRPDLDESIVVLDRAGQLAPPNSTLKGHALDQMARSLSTRYDLAESQDDLETIIQACCQALDLLPNSPERPGYSPTCTRCAGHFVRGDLQDIEEVVDRLLQADRVGCTATPLYRPPDLNNLGNALYDLYARTAAYLSRPGHRLLAGCGRSGAARDSCGWRAHEQPGGRVAHPVHALPTTCTTWNERSICWSKPIQAVPSDVAQDKVAI